MGPRLPKPVCRPPAAPILLPPRPRRRAAAPHRIRPAACCSIAARARARRRRPVRGHPKDVLPLNCTSSYSAFQSTNRPTDRPTDRPTNPPTNQPTNQPTNYSPILLMYLSISLSLHPVITMHLFDRQGIVTVGLIFQGKTPFLERLAEYCWKPHRVCLAQKGLWRATIHWYMHIYIYIYIYIYNKGVRFHRIRDVKQTVLCKQYSANLPFLY